MTDGEIEETELLTDSELLEINERFKRMELEGVSDTQKYFDRIHDKLFSLNNLLIGGYIALIAFLKEVSYWILIIPIINSIILLHIDYRMLRRARIQANITKANEKEIKKYGTTQNNTNLYSLISIWSTILVIIVFVYFLFISKH